MSANGNAENVHPHERGLLNLVLSFGNFLYEEAPDLFLFTHTLFHSALFLFRVISKGKQ